LLSTLAPRERHRVLLGWEMNPMISVLSSRRWNRRGVAFAVAALVACSWCVEKSVYAATLCQPNIVVILADDLGYGEA
jgi:hypothetical protein